MAMSDMGYKNDLEFFLENARLSKYAKVLQGVSLEKLLKISYGDLKNFFGFKIGAITKFKKAKNDWLQSMLVKKWLEKNGFEEYANNIINSGIDNMNKLILIDYDYILYDRGNFEMLQQDGANLMDKIITLKRLMGNPESKEVEEFLKSVGYGHLVISMIDGGINTMEDISILNKEIFMNNFYFTEDEFNSIIQAKIYKNIPYPSYSPPGDVALSSNKIEIINNCNDKLSNKNVRLVISHALVSKTILEGNTIKINKVPRGVRLVFLVPLGHPGMYVAGDNYDKFSSLIKNKLSQGENNIYDIIKEYFSKGWGLLGGISKFNFEFTLKKAGEMYNDLNLFFQQGSYIECLNTNGQSKQMIEGRNIKLSDLINEKGKGLYIIGGCRIFRNFSSEQKIIAKLIDNETFKKKNNLLKRVKKEIQMHKLLKEQVNEWYKFNEKFKNDVDNVNDLNKQMKKEINIEQIKYLVYLVYQQDVAIEEDVDKRSKVEIVVDMLFKNKNPILLPSDEHATPNVKNYFNDLDTPNSSSRSVSFNARGIKKKRNNKKSKKKKKVRRKTKKKVRKKNKKRKKKRQKNKK